MYSGPYLHLMSGLLGAALLLANHGLRAESDTNAADSGQQTMLDTTTTGTVSNGAVSDRLSQEFADLLGGEEQAREVIAALRENGPQPPETESVAGDAVTDSGIGDTAAHTSGQGDMSTRADDTPNGDMLSADGGGDSTIGEHSAANPSTPTKTLGYGEIRHTLKLARAELDKLGISQPSDTELNAMLYGGDVNGTQVEGVLALRAGGMGWGQIAQTYGYKLGSVVGNGHNKAATDVTQSNPAGSAASHRSAQVSTAGGYIPSGAGATGHAYGRGLVTAGGTMVGTPQTRTHGKAISHAKAGQGQLVRAAGNPHGAAGVSSAARASASSQGLAKGHSR